MPPAVIVLGFLLSAGAVVFAGVRLTRHGDAIAARTQLGGLWVGAVFLAVATSLPELTTDIAAVRLDAPDLAAGDLFGSSMANMLILAIVSLLPGAEIFRRAALDNGLGAALAISLTAIAALLILVRPGVSVAGVGVGSLVLATVYLVGMRAIFRSSVVMRTATGVEEMTVPPVATGEAPTEESREVPPASAPAPADEPTSDEAGTKESLRSAAIGFALASLIILVAAPLFAASAKALAEVTGLATSFIGTWLVGFATSLPELTTSVAAVRMRAYDLAVGNLFGSNAFNMVLFLPLDLAHRSGPFLAAIEQVHAISALVAIVLMAIGLAAIVYRAGGRWRALEPSGLIMMLVYLAGLWLVFLRGGGA